MFFYVTSISEIHNRHNRSSSSTNPSTSSLILRGRSDDYNLIEVRVDDFYPTCFYSPPFSIIGGQGQFRWSELEEWANGFIEKIEKFLSQKVRKWSFCKGRTMYHYSGFSLPFLEISLHSSLDIKKLLNHYNVSDEGVYIHEAHLPLHLQFMISTTISPFSVIELKRFTKLSSNLFLSSWRDVCQDERIRRPRENAMGPFPTHQYMIPSLQRMLTKLSLQTQTPHPTTNIKNEGIKDFFFPIKKERIPGLLRLRTMFSSYQASLSLISPFQQTFIEDLEYLSNDDHSNPKKMTKMREELSQKILLDPMLIMDISNKKPAFLKREEKLYSIDSTLKRYSQLKRAPLPSELGEMTLLPSSRVELSQIALSLPMSSKYTPTPTPTQFPPLTMLGIDILLRKDKILLIVCSLFNAQKFMERKTFRNEKWDLDDDDEIKSSFRKYYLKINPDLIFAFRMENSVRLLKIPLKGKVLIPVQSFLKNENPSLSLLSFENLVKEVIRKKICLVPLKILLKEWSISNYFMVERCLEEKISLQHEMILPFLRKNCEFSSLIGINLSEIIWRGSQIRVESMMGRLGRVEDFLFLSPTPSMVRGQRAPSVIPLVLEPLSAFYEDPIIVLDFQSLYPSIMIANNICYSTCLGDGKSYGVLGLKDLPGCDVGDALLSECHQTSTGAIFVNSSIREGILPKMLSELLSSRQKVKGFDEYKQLALKLIANVTYGYTAASYSGRMPNVTIADAIVQCGRDALQKAISFIEVTFPNTKVVYGDTDSIFIQCPSFTRGKAQALGKRMAILISELFPFPMRMNFEKVYHPSILVAKKRYVGFSYGKDGNIGSLDVKGLEIVRKDACPLLKVIMEKSLMILFTSYDLLPLKVYIQRQFLKILLGAPKDLSLFLLSKKGPRDDVIVMEWNKERDRIPFLVYQDEGVKPLMHRMIDPISFVVGGKKIDIDFYLKRRIIPPLNRIFIFLGIDCHKWLDELPRMKKKITEKSGIDLFLERRTCIICNERCPSSSSSLCGGCFLNEQRTIYTKWARIRDKERMAIGLLNSCSNTFPYEMCYSLCCKKFWGMVDFITIEEPH